MRLVGSSDPDAASGDEVMWLLHERVVLTGAVCRELVSASRDDFLDSRPRAALDLLRRWVGARYAKDVETRPGDGLGGMVVPRGAEGLMVELRAGTRVCEALATLWTADTPTELRGDAAEVRTCLRDWERTLRQLRDDDEPDDDWPSLAVHAPAGTVVVTPGGEQRHRGTFPLPGHRVHVLGSATPTSALLGSDAARHAELVADLERRGGEVWWAFDPAQPTRESAVVAGLTDDQARKVGAAWGQASIVRWDEQAWTELPCDGAEASAFGWANHAFDWDRYAGDALELRRLRPNRLVETWTVSGAPGCWTVHHRPGDGSGARTSRADDDRLLDVVAGHREIGVLRRGVVTEFTLHGDLDPAMLALTLTAEATEGSEEPDDWPDDVSRRWDDGDRRWADGLPWVHRWASVDGVRLSVLWAGGTSLVVPRDVPVEELDAVVGALRADEDVVYPWPSRPPGTSDPFP